MNVFRLLFLAIVLVASFSVAVVNLVPDVIERVTNDALEDRARVEAVLLHERELRADSERLAMANRIALQDTVVRALSAPPGFGGPPADSMFRQASAPLWNNASVDLDGLFLLDASSNVIDARTRGSVDASLLERADAASVLTAGTSATRFVHTDGRLYAVTTVPVMVNSRAVGAVALIQHYDASLVAGRRSGPGANAAWFVGREIIVSNITDDDVAERAGRVVRGLTPAGIGLPNMLRTREVFDVEADFGQQRVLIAPVRVGPPGESSDAFGTLAIVEGPVPSTNPIASISDSGVLDEGSMRIWVTIALGLIAFFLGLFLLDAALDRATRRLARRIRDDATANDPPPLEASDYPVWLRDVADAFNAFLEAYRSHTPRARRARQEVSGADELPTSGSGPLVLPRVEAALEASGESMWARADEEAVDLAPDDFEKIPTGMLRLDTGEQVTVGSLSRADAPVAPQPTEESVVEDAIIDEVAIDDEREDSDEMEELEGAADAFLRDLSGESAATEAEEHEPESHSSIERPIAPIEPGDWDLPDDDADEGAAPRLATGPEFEIVGAADEAAAPPVFDVLDEEDATHTTLPSRSPAASMFADDDDESAALLDEVSGSLEAALSGPYPAVTPRDETSIQVIDGVAESAGEPYFDDEPEHSTMFRDLSGDDAAEARAAMATAEDVSALIAQIHAPPAAEDGAEGEEASDTELDETADAVLAELEAAEAAGTDLTTTLPGYTSASYLAAVEDEPSDEVAPEQSAESAGSDGDADQPAEEDGLEAEEDGLEAEEDGLEAEEADEQPAEGDDAPEPAAEHDAGGADDDVPEPPAEEDDADGGTAEPPADSEESDEAEAPEAPPLSELDEEADDEDAPAEPVDSSKTVPRVSLDDLAAQAAARSGEAPDLLAAAEARLRALRPEASEPVDHHALYDRFVRAKESCNEDTSRLTYERFVAKLERNRDALMKRYQCSDVQFQVTIRDGKVTLKATPVR